MQVMPRRGWLPLPAYASRGANATSSRSSFDSIQAEEPASPYFPSDRDSGGDH
jgi:hypothetical protein